MPRYSVAPPLKAGVNTANTVMWQFRAGATYRAYIREIGIFVGVAPTAAPVFVLARSLTLGTSTTALAGVSNDPADPASITFLDTVWSAPPTFTTTGPFIRSMGLPVTAGNGVIWNFADEPLVLAPGAGLAIANLIATGATLGSFGCYVTTDE